MKTQYALPLLILLLFLSFACNIATPAPATRAPALPTAIIVTPGAATLSTPTIAAVNPNPSPAPAVAGKYRIHIRMTTTSDWTTFVLVDGASWRESTLISASSETTFHWLEEHRFLLSQAIERANAGKRVEMVFESYLFDVKSDMLIFEIERGHLGDTQVEVSNYLGDKPILAATLVWDSINPGERNAQRFEIPVEKLINKMP